MRIPLFKKSLQRLSIPPTKRIYFLDALRAFAIVMMLQGHFVSGLLDKTTVDVNDPFYRMWLYCRGFTAPIFFTITGWVFTFLLLKAPQQGWKNPRIKKGFRRGVELLVWGYLLRLNLPTLFKGEINGSFIQPDVLHIIGLSLFYVLVVYLCFSWLKKGLGVLFMILGVVVFLTQPLYSGIVFEELPKALAGYLVKGNDGVFYLFPWLGYVSIGTAIAYFLQHQYDKMNLVGILFFVLGLFLIYKSSAFFIYLDGFAPGTLLSQVANNNFLFIRLGDVFLLMGVFVWLQPFLKNKAWFFIGTKTLSLYIVHYFVLYGSLTGLGLYGFFNHSWEFPQTALGAMGFIVLCIGLVVLFDFLKKRFLKTKTK